MGWVAGLLCLLAFYIISVGASLILANLYEVDGKKYGSYGAAVKAFMGKWHRQLLDTQGLHGHCAVCCTPHSKTFQRFALDV